MDDNDISSIFESAESPGSSGIDRNISDSTSSSVERICPDLDLLERCIADANPDYGRFVSRLLDRAMELPFKTTYRFLSDVVVFDTKGQADRLFEWLYLAGKKYPNQFYLFAFHTDHVHIFHDCAFSNKSCRCHWRQAPCIQNGIRRRLRRGIPYARTFGRSAFKNVFDYFLVREGFQKKNLFLGGREQRFSYPSVYLSSSGNETNNRLVETQSIRVRCDLCSEFGNRENDKSSFSHSIEGIKEKRSPFRAYSEKISFLLKKYYCVPPENIRRIIPRTSTDFDINFFNPQKEQQYDNSIELFKQELNHLKLRDFYNILCKTIPVFYSPTIDPFEYYHTLEDSYKYLMELLHFQFNHDEQRITLFLNNIVRWFNREGWMTENGELNPKINTIVCLGPVNCGKNYFWDPIVSIAGNVGHIGRVNNKTNHFALQDAVHRRIAIGNEVNMEEGAKEDFKKICEGKACNISVKHKKDGIMLRTPVILISNSELFCATDPHFVDIRCTVLRWRSFPLLKESKLQAYPMAVFKLFEFFNVDF